MTDPDFSEFPLRARGGQFEDLEERQVFEHELGLTPNGTAYSAYSGEREVLIRRRSWGHR